MSTSSPSNQAAALAAIIPPDLAELFEGGLSILVGTRDAKLLPETTYGCGAIVHPDRRTMTVFMPVRTAARAIANLEDNRQIAVALSSVLDHKSLQVKGTAIGVRPANEAEHQVITRYHAAYAEILFTVGYPRAISRSMNVWPSHAVTFEVTDIFHQTPGPGAGERLKPAT